VIQNKFEALHLSLGSQREKKKKKKNKESPLKRLTASAGRNYFSGKLYFFSYP